MLYCYSSGCSSTVARLAAQAFRLTMGRTTPGQAAAIRGATFPLTTVCNNTSTTGNEDNMNYHVINPLPVEREIVKKKGRYSYGTHKVH